MSESSLFAAFGAVLGYIGAEAATGVYIDTLLWPQRFYSNYTFTRTTPLSLIMSMGGPMHQAALRALDSIFSHGLLDGTLQGHMLGTGFFPKSSWKYTMHGDGEHTCSRTDWVRNCLWVRTLSFMPVTRLDSRAAPHSDAAGKGLPRQKRVRQRASYVVNHLTISKPTPTDIRSSNISFVSESGDTPGFCIYLAICVTETTALIMSIGVSAVTCSFWGLFWLIPLFLRLLSALCALEREPLISTSSATANDPPRDFEFHYPESESSFMIITGPPAIVTQFVRHYGHPIRNRFRELFQFTVITCFAAHFPVGLFLCAMCMPQGVQATWLCYQLYVVLSMHVQRYTHLPFATSTEATLAKQLSQGELVVRDDHLPPSRDTEILFGVEREGSGTVKVHASIKYCDSYREGKATVDRLLGWEEKTLV